MSSNPEEVGLSTLNVTAVIIDRNIAILIVNFDRCVARFNAQKLLITRDNDAVRIINRETAILLVFAQCTNRRRRQDSRTTPTDKKKKKKKKGRRWWQFNVVACGTQLIEKNIRRNSVRVPGACVIANWR